MADTKISGLTALAAADVETDADVLAIVDDSATTTKKITVDNFRTAIGPKLETEQATTSGTSIDFTSIPSWVKKITLLLAGVSMDASDTLLVQLGDSGGVETTGYLGANNTLTGSGVSGANYTTGFGVGGGTAASVLHGAVHLSLEDSSNNTWVCTALTARSDNTVTNVGGGSKSLSGTLDRVRLTTLGGSTNFDAGGVNIIIE